MKRTRSDAVGPGRTNLSGQAGNEQDVREDPDAGENQSAQQPIPTVRVDNDRQATGLAPLFFPPQQELTAHFLLNAPPGQLFFRAEMPDTALHGNEAPRWLGPTSYEQASGSTDSLSPGRGCGLCAAEAASNELYRSELSAWVESAETTERANHQEAERRIDAYLEAPVGQRKLIDLSTLVLSTLAPLPADLIELDVRSNKLTALPEHLPQGLQRLDVRSNKLTALPEHLPQGLQRLYVGDNQLTALPEHLPKGLQELALDCNGLTALPEHLPQGLQTLLVDYNKLSALPEHLPQSLRTLSVEGTRLDPKTLVALMRTNTSITDLGVDWPDIDAGSSQELDAELLNNRYHPARRDNAAVTLDLLTRFAFTESDQTGALIQRDPTPNPVAGRLPEQPIPAELHKVLAENCPKGLLAELSGMVDGTAQ